MRRLTIRLGWLLGFPHVATEAKCTFSTRLSQRSWCDRQTDERTSQSFAVPVAAKQGAAPDRTTRRSASASSGERPLTAQELTQLLRIGRWALRSD